MHNQSYPSAGLLRRLAAMGYDSLVIMSLAMLYGGVFLAIKYWALQTELPAGEKASMGTAGFVGLLLLIEMFYWYFWCKDGQTLGMRAWRLRVRGNDGGPIRLEAAVLRGLCAPLSLALAGLGYFWCLWDKEGKTWHDRLSGTEVVVLPKIKK